MIANLLLLVSQAKDKSGKLLIDFQNRQYSLKNEEKRRLVFEQVIGKLLNQSPWKEISQANEENKQIIIDYFIGVSEDLPSILDTEKVATEAIIIHQLIGGNWLQDRLAKNEDEHFGFPSSLNQLRVAVFYESRKPLDKSKFSNAYVMIINTLICYLIHGLNTEQIKEMVIFLQKEASNEAKMNQEEGLYCTKTETTVYQLFYKVTGLDLFLIDMNQNENGPCRISLSSFDLS